MPDFHPDLRAARLLPGVGPPGFLAPWAHRLRPRPRPAPGDLEIGDELVPGLPGAPPVRVRVYRPRRLVAPAPALVWLHGGGFFLGSPEMDEDQCIAFARELPATVVSVDYRLAPGHPYPAALDDAYAALLWTADRARRRGVDPTRIAVGGASAGGGLAAGLVLRAHDAGQVRPVFQLLVYPMLDDRTTTRTDLDTRGLRLWTPRSNRFGWTAYLGRPPGGDGVPDHAAPGRRDDLGGLPPAWIGIGDHDLFRDEALRYARRLTDAGVRCELVVVPGAFHAFDVAFRNAGVSREFRRAQVRALRAALHPDG